MIMTAIRANELTKDYSSIRALDSLNLEVPRGSIFGFLGPNGAGKTTTIRLLLGLIFPTWGEAEVMGENPFTSYRFKEKIGYVSENRVFYENFKVEEIIAFTRSCYLSWSKEREEELIKLFELPLNQKIKNLSKGMKSQLAFVLAFCHQPELLILDEPTEGMDPLTRRDFLTTLLNAEATEGTTVFISSHLLNEVERIADRVGLLFQGKLILAKALDELKETEFEVEAAFVKPPSVEELENISGIISAEKQGEQWLLSYQGEKEKLQSQLSLYEPTYLNFNPLSLEEIFFRYAGRERLGIEKGVFENEA